MFFLYADDDPEDLETLSDVLNAIIPGSTCIHARDGVEVLDILEHAPSVPDFIFLDINMPLMDGRACLKELKKDERFASVPVVIYTTSNNPRDQQLCMELGASAYFVKPTTFTKAVESLREFLKSYKMVQ